MADQLSFLDGPGRKQAGMQKALAGKLGDYPERFCQAVLALARAGHPFSADDVVGIVGVPHRSEANRNNAVGALMSACAKQGWVKPSGGWTKSARPESHSRLVRQWIGVASVMEVMDGS
jgi:hypothetical protein